MSRPVAVILCLVTFLSVIAAADLPTLPPLLSDHAVLQRGLPIPIQGTAQAAATVAVALGDHSATTQSDADGRWSLLLPAMPAGGPYTLTVACGEARTEAKEIMIGDVWLCAGQSNMAFGLKGAAHAGKHVQSLEQHSIRLMSTSRRLSTDPQTDFQAGHPIWKVCTPETAPNFSAVAQAFAATVQEHEAVTIGLIQVTWAGSFIEGWIPPGIMADNPDYAPILERWKWLDAEREQLQATWVDEHAAWKRDHGERFTWWRQTPVGGRFHPHEPSAPAPATSHLRPSVIWNGMVAPYTAAPLRGVVWYQGESNTDRAWQYRTLLRDLVTSWRTAWAQPELPFIIAQLPEYETDTCPYDYQDWGAWEVLRESQAIAANLPATGLAVTLGLGDPYDIHPRGKWPLGQRLGRVALAVAYGHDVTWSGPRLLSATVDGNSMTLRFTHTEGGLMTINGGPVRGLEIAGADRNFVAAEAVITGPDTLTVTAASVSEPVAVRYAWNDNPLFNLICGKGLMAGPFRSDDWPVPTQAATVPFGNRWPVVQPALQQATP